MFSKKLKRLRQNNLSRIIKDRGSAPKSNTGHMDAGPGQFFTQIPSRISIDGTEYINFASNDYLGLSGNRLLMEAAKEAINIYGFGPGASRLLSGGTELHTELEKTVAAFKDTESALIFNSGYAANISAIPCIADEGDTIFSDELNHASIVDGCRLSRAKKVIYPHKNISNLSELLKNDKGSLKIVITETIFSMDGDIAPIRELYQLCLDHDAILYLDDAHGTGVLGDGHGALKHFQLKTAPWLIQMGTFSKALGSYGAFIAGSRNVTEWLINTGRGFIYSTALPACVVAASVAALEIIQKENGPVQTLCRTLWKNRERLFNGIRDLGFNIINSESPIIPVSTENVETALRFSEHLMKHHIYAPAIRPPTVRTPRIRFTVTAAHTDKDIDRLIDVMKTAKLNALI